MLRAGSGPPLVLLHGVMGSERHWTDVIPLLQGDFDVIALTALGHRGGPPAPPTAVHFADIADDAEAQLDELGIERAHLAGNSMGGWIALELASRSRGLSACALSPAGMWDEGSGHGGDLLRRDLRLGRWTRPVLPPVLRSRAVRRWALRHVACRGGRLTRHRTLELVDDMLGCEVGEELLRTPERYARDELDCPVTVAWAERDAIFPVSEFGPVARERVPDARHIVLPGVGHVPMLDDPDLVARAIREAAA
jgi:pimeloyl-ACP methyl ester carboxylesterase